MLRIEMSILWDGNGTKISGHDAILPFIFLQKSMHYLKWNNHVDTNCVTQFVSTNRRDCLIILFIRLRNSNRALSFVKFGYSESENLNNVRICT